MNAGKKGRLIRFDYSQIFYVEAIDHFMHFFCRNRKEIVKISMQKLFAQLPEKLCAELHKVEQFLRCKSNFGYIALQEGRILSLLNSNAKERYEQFLLQYPALFQRVPKTLIAAYLGASRETLNRFSF